MKDKLDRLASLGQVLNLETNLLGEQISAFELILNRLNLGFHTWVTIKKESDPEYPIQLGYVKELGKWGLYIRQGTETWHINSAPRIWRIVVVPHFEELIDAMLKNAQKITSRLGESTEKAKAFVEAINNGLNETPDLPPIHKIREGQSRS